MFRVKEIFYTLQGEGRQAGRAAVFCRFSGCNLWSGREEDRAKALCQFCDTNFLGNILTFADEKSLLYALTAVLPQESYQNIRPYVVFTGGEPSLQLTQELIDILHEHNWKIGIESNGTHTLPLRLDWICISPKAGTKLLILHGNELKLVYPQNACNPSDFAHLNFQSFILQPCDNGNETRHNTELCIEYCLRHPQWRLGVQMHKWIGVR